MKGALTGNAAQVLWDTDRFATVSLRKLVDTLVNDKRRNIVRSSRSDGENVQKVFLIYTRISED